MTPDKILKRVVLDRLDWVDRMIAEIQSLPLQDQAVFLKDSRNVWTAESCLRRALEALLDLGRHILAKGFAIGVTTYKEVADELEKWEVIPKETAVLLRLMAGYRNRMVHFYYEITPDEFTNKYREKIDIYHQNFWSWEYEEQRTWRELDLFMSYVQKLNLNYYVSIHKENIHQVKTIDKSRILDLDNHKLYFSTLSSYLQA